MSKNEEVRYEATIDDMTGDWMVYDRMQDIMVSDRLTKNEAIILAFEKNES
jgi:hypothetical protein